MARRVVIILVLGLQVVAASLFMFDLMIPILGIPVILDWTLHEVIELTAAISLIVGVVMGTLLLRRIEERAERVESQLRAASGAFAELMQDRFEEWELTPSERDVALFSIKGLSIQDIAAIREVSEGTVKAQTNAIYRKAGVSGRPQLLSLFIEDLMDGPIT
nr:helix-turn-helix transcriptional regulator [uncultured Tateyamaria sp.]